MNENKSKIIILVGRSGSGKGTQGKLIKEFMQKNFPERKLLYLSTGEEMRKFAHENHSYSALLSKRNMEEGKLQPMFFSVYVWAKYLMDSLTGNENIVFDGVPRRKQEAKILDSAVRFYNWPKPVVINIEVSEEECINRMKLRAREDDNLENFKKKMDWYKVEVEPMLEWYKETNLYTYVEINGVDTVENIFRHIDNFLTTHYNL
jgi:adenylate kinase family enzyme